MASPMVRKAIPRSARPGTGMSRATEPSATTRTSYSISSVLPSGLSTVTTRRAVSILLTRRLSTWQRLSTRRSGTTTCRGSIAPAAASGRNGW
jgi:hypothetical protein